MFISLFRPQGKTKPSAHVYIRDLSTPQSKISTHIHISLQSSKAKPDLQHILHFSSIPKTKSNFHYIHSFPFKKQNKTYISYSPCLSANYQLKLMFISLFTGVCGLQSSIYSTTVHKSSTVKAT